MKIMILGHKNHGKDFLAEYISKKLNLKFISATDFFFRNVLIDRVEGFKTIEDCLRLKESTLGREYLYNLLNDYNDSDGSGFKSIKDVLKISDIYCGCRDINAYLSAKKEGLIDFTIWVDSGERLEPESSSSINIDSSVADYIIKNNGSKDDFINEIDKMLKIISSYIAANKTDNARSKKTLNKNFNYKKPVVKISKYIMYCTTWDNRFLIGTSLESLLDQIYEPYKNKL